MGILDKTIGTAGAALRLGGGIAEGAVKRLRGGGGSPPVAKDIGDADLTNKVRSVIFRGMRGVDKGAIDVNVVDGAVYLRGTAKNQQQIRTLEARARAIPEVSDVHVLLHLPKTPAPTRTDTPAAQRKTRRGGSTPRKPRTEPRRVNADKTAARGETPPEELAREGAGRQAAPLGAREDA